MQKIFKMLLGMLIAFMLLPALVFGASEITFQWDSNTEFDLAGYRMYQSAASGVYTYGSGSEALEIPVGTDTGTITVSDGTWFWVVTAYDTSGNESGPSNEVTAVLDSVGPNAPTNYIIKVIIKIQ